MSIENKNESCRCKELKERANVLKDNDRLAEILGKRSQVCFGAYSSTTGDDKSYKEKFEELFEINHGWKKDYEELHMRYEMLKGEKRLLEDEEKDLKLRISELEKRQGSLENELARLASALDAQQSCSNGGRSEEQCEILKSQMIVYKEDFEKERKEREMLHEEKEKYKNKLEDSEEIIKKLTTELDACQAREEARRRSWSELGYLGDRITSPNNDESVDQEWRREQPRGRILSQNPPAASHFITWENMISTSL